MKLKFVLGIDFDCRLMKYFNHLKNSTIMSLDLPAKAQILTTEQISNLQPGQTVFHSEWGNGIFRGKRLGSDGTERFVIDNYNDNLEMKDLNGDLYLIDGVEATGRIPDSDDSFVQTHAAAAVDENDVNDVFLNKMEDDLDSLSGQLNEGREDVVSVDSVKSYQTQTSDLLAKINREVEFTESKLKKLKDLRQSLYTHLGKVGHFLNEGDTATAKNIFDNENVDRAKTFIQKESKRFYEELKDEINDLKNSFGFRNKRN
ncbi:MAG: hypothetical protein BGN92_11620 [Sphingobacteriales bacterium 41-5]|nr:MAG: hypothetical protein BGN92_11620 [Sphingobacteriales bacterium 41-5]